MATPGELVLRHHALKRLNRIKTLATGKRKMRKAASDRVRMHNQVGEILRRSGVEHEKPADIIKRIVTKGKVLPENVSKLSAEEARNMLKEAIRALLPLKASGVSLVSKPPVQRGASARNDVLPLMPMMPMQPFSK